jgi:hypothetical protein
MHSDGVPSVSPLLLLVFPGLKPNMYIELAVLHPILVDIECVFVLPSFFSKL